MAASIYGSQVQSAAQSLAAYLQALQAKANGNAAANGSAATDGAAASSATTAANSAGTKTGKDPAQQISSQPLDVVTLSAEAQRLLANAQAPSIGPGSLATYLNTSNSFDGTNSVNGANSDPFSSGYEGAIAQFRQWLSQPLGQPVPYTGDQAATDGSKNGTDSAQTKSGDAAGSAGPTATSSTSS
ncbi:MAG TPA: hypothetical protein VM639_09535 [Dongiaceae bacterium]|nr:hypothetical protein [Dongiaceae bacterium]